MKNNWMSQMLVLFSFISCNFSKQVAFFTSQVSQKLVDSTFWCLVDSVVASVHKNLGTVFSKPFANAMCKLLSHEHFLMSNSKCAHDHLQKAINSTIGNFWAENAEFQKMSNVHSTLE